MNDPISRTVADLRVGGNAHSAVMFGTTLLFLGVLAVVLQWWNSSHIIDPDSDLTLLLMAVVWIPFLVEGTLGLLLNPRLQGNRKRFLLVTLAPPFRLGYSTFSTGDTIWLPFLGRRPKDLALFEELERRAAVPMLFIALMILPLLAAEFLLKDKVAGIPWLGTVLDASAAFIWFAFASEFIVMVSVAEEKLTYCRKHWINLLIILMPLLAFLRGFQVIRAFRAARSAHLLRMYRMRGLLLRLQQALIALSAIERLMYRNPERHLKKLEKVRAEKLRELQTLERKISEVTVRAGEYRARREASRPARSRADP